MTKAPIALLATLALGASLAGCQTYAAKAPATEAAPPAPPAFVEAACGGCHAVEPPFLSPNPKSPSFATIANRDGLTEDTIEDWLLNAHNYPEDMDFDLTAEQTRQIAAYMITLRSDDYRPQPN